MEKLELKASSVGPQEAEVTFSSLKDKEFSTKGWCLRGHALKIRPLLDQKSESHKVFVGNLPSNREVRESEI